MTRSRISPTLLKRLLWLWFGLFLPLLLAGVIAEDVWDRERYAFEQPLMLAVHRYTAGTLWEEVALVLHWLGKWPAATLMAVLLAWYESRQQRRARAVFVLAGAALSTAIMSVAKAFFDRARPELWPRLVEETSASFPSGHSTFAAALAVTVVLLCWQRPYRWPVLVLAVALAALAGFSRVVLGVHYPTDVLVGWITGALTVLGIFQIMRGRWWRGRAQ
ncbi:undecaprenyl-diphosphatase [Neisseria sp. HSC-16F19]|nr:phosphatase PAP2 family protein [Neisseria sp. HSC-16F19]MCP2041198.1 undecaprenyl-diphosphatase [Neisseria sp. HSC-16F19]